MRRHSRLLVAGSVAVLLVAFQTGVRVAEPAQPSLLKDINTLVSGSSSSPNQFTIVGGIAFFTAADGPHGRELWETDGTPAGTHLLKRSEEHTSELQSRLHLVCRLLLEKKKKTKISQFGRRIVL